MCTNEQVLQAETAHRERACMAYLKKIFFKSGFYPVGNLELFESF